MSDAVRRKCKQCTEVKDITEFRKYRYKPSKENSERSRQLYCGQCEYINSSLKKAIVKGDVELQSKIEELLQAFTSIGGIIPKSKRVSTNILSLLDTVKAKTLIDNNFHNWTVEEWFTKSLDNIDLEAAEDYLITTLRPTMCRYIGESTEHNLGLYEEPDYSNYKRIYNRVANILWQ